MLLSSCFLDGFLSTQPKKIVWEAVGDAIRMYCAGGEL